MWLMSFSVSHVYEKAPDCQGLCVQAGKEKKSYWVLLQHCYQTDLGLVIWWVINLLGLLCCLFFTSVLSCFFSSLVTCFVWRCSLSTVKCTSLYLPHCQRHVTGVRACEYNEQHKEPWLKFTLQSAANWIKAPFSIRIPLGINRQ